MIAGDMTNGGIEVELSAMRREAREGREGEATVEGEQDRVENVLGTTEDGGRTVVGEEDAAEEGAHEWERSVAGRDTDFSSSSSYKREEKGKCSDREGAAVDCETSTSTKRKRTDEEVAVEMQLEEYGGTVEHSSQEPEPGAQDTVGQRTWRWSSRLRVRRREIHESGWRRG